MSELAGIMQNLAHQVVMSAVGRASQSLRARLPRGKLTLPTGILLAPASLLQGDADRAKEYYRGCFDLAGERIELGARSPFASTAGSEAWRNAVSSFGWLADFASAGSALPRAQARTLIAEWISLHGRKPDADWGTALVSSRLMSWLRYAPFYLENASEEFHRALMLSFARQIRHLSSSLSRVIYPPDRLNGTIAFATSVLCLEGLEKYHEKAAAFLVQELERQILPDGDHISRDPSYLLDVILQLIPLRQAFEGRQIAPPDSLQTVIDRSIPFLATLTHGDGGLAFFNGASGSRKKALKSVFTNSSSTLTPLSHARHSGYVRLSQGETLVIMDTGKPAAPGQGAAGHASSLSFELSHGHNRVVVNCGSCPDGPPEWRTATCATAAHSTLILDGQSSGQVLSQPWLKRLVGGPVVLGPSLVEAELDASPTGSIVSAQHNGYERSYGLQHKREIYVASHGGDVRGEDRLYDTTGRADQPQRHPFAIRFHLHPSVKATKSQDGKSVLALLPSKAGWRFNAKGANVMLEESVYFDGRSVPQRTQQIVLTGSVDCATSIKWAFKLLDKATERREPPKPAPLPLAGGGMNEA